MGKKTINSFQASLFIFSVDVTAERYIYNVVEIICRIFLIVYCKIVIIFFHGKIH
jgi:hypothetical protein